MWEDEPTISVEAFIEEKEVDKLLFIFQNNESNKQDIIKTNYSKNTRETEVS